MTTYERYVRGPDLLGHGRLGAGPGAVVRDGADIGVFEPGITDICTQYTRTTSSYRPSLDAARTAHHVNGQWQCVTVGHTDTLLC